MTSVALALVVAAAFCHAAWNLLLKRSGATGPAFIWVVLAASCVIYAPVAAVVAVVERPHIDALDALFMAGSAVLHVGYFLFLQRGYATGDLSLVYPLARGTGPALATVGAIVLLDERPGPVVLAGTALVVAGLVALSRPATILRGGAARGAVAAALLTGAFIAVYTVWDAYAVATLAIPPVLYDWSSNLGRVAFLSPLARPTRPRIRAVLADHGRDVLAIAALSPLAYILVLIALASTPVSYVAPARELSIVIGAVAGTWLLGEGDARRRIACAATIAAGIVLLAVG